MPTPSPTVARHPRLAELALSLGGFGIGTSEFVIMGLLERVADDLQVATADVGYAISSYALGVVVGAPLIAALAARAPRRSPLIAQRKMYRKPRPGLPRGFDKPKYRERNVVERAFSWLKELRRIATRYDKLARSFRAMVCLACMSRCLRADFSYRT